MVCVFSTWAGWGFRTRRAVLLMGELLKAGREWVAFTLVFPLLAKGWLSLRAQ